MLPQVKTKTQKLERYKDIIPDSLFEQIRSLAPKFKGLRVVHLNSTPRGGGVAEVLKSLVPLMKGVGVEAEWHTIPSREDFFEITKKIHNALQGKKYGFLKSDQKKYLEYIKEIAEMAQEIKADVWVLHDPQPAGIIKFLPEIKPAISHIHIDTSFPDKKTWAFIKDILKKYDKIIFSAKEFLQPTLDKEKIEIFPPAIDPLTEKNKELSFRRAKLILESFGLDPQKPLVCQVSRFDPWKDPIGVIKAYKIAKKKVPNLQLAYAGLFLSHDDPEAMRIFQKAEQESKDDPDIFLFSNPDRLGSLRVDTFVNACQTGSDIVLQKSIKEGFGLTVSEAMWKGRPVIGANVGGIKLQIENNKNGFLVSSVEEAGARIVELLKNKELSSKLGRAAKETVRQKFLMPRLLYDYLNLFKEAKLTKKS